jgi:protein associated with RNAse G/E
LGPLLFLLYVNDLPKVIEHKALPILLADDSSMLITAPNTTRLQNDVNIVFGQANKWFEANFLSLNLDKTHFIQLINKIIYTTDMCIKYDDMQIFNITNTKFLGLFVNDTLSWKTHIEYISLN